MEARAAPSSSRGNRVPSQVPESPQWPERTLGSGLGVQARDVEDDRKRGGRRSPFRRARHGGQRLHGPRVNTGVTPKPQPLDIFFFNGRSSALLAEPENNHMKMQLYGLISLVCRKETS